MLFCFFSCFHLFKQLGALFSFQIIFRPQTVCEQNRELFSVPACLCCQLISFHRSLEQVRWLFVWWWKIIRAGKALCDLRLLIAIKRDGVLRDYAPSTPEKKTKNSKSLRGFLDFNSHRHHFPKVMPQLDPTGKSAYRYITKRRKLNSLTWSYATSFSSGVSFFFLHCVCRLYTSSRCCHHLQLAANTRNIFFAWLISSELQTSSLLADLHFLLFFFFISWHLAQNCDIMFHW